MDRIAKIVSRRLQARPDPGPHPDPGLVAAFAENALSQAERGRLLEHLGACSECREILYLALPEATQVQKVLVLRSRPFRQWALGWGALVASVAIAAIFLSTNRLGHRSQAHAPIAATTSAGATETETKIAADKSPPQLDQIQAARDATARKTVVALQKSEPKSLPPAKRMTGKLQPELVFEDSGQVHVQSQEKSADAMGALVSKDDRQKQNVRADWTNGSVAQTGSAGKLRGYAYARSEPSQTKEDQQAVSGQQTSVQANAVSGSDSEQYVRNAPAKKETTQTLPRTNALNDLPAAEEVSNLTVAPQQTGGSAQNRKTSGAALSDLRLAHGSTLKGNLDGTIVDPSGAVIGKAKIMVVGPTGAKTASSDPQGRFSFDFLPPGSYSIKAWASGFKATEIKQVAVLDNKTSSVQVRLNLGSASEVVEVTSAAPSASAVVGVPGAVPVTSASTGLIAEREQTVEQLSKQKAAATNSRQQEIGGAIGAGSGAAAASFAWTLSPQGAVERSDDNAKTWQAVPVTAGVTFRALAAVGSNVWVGGKAGALYHSADSGQTWAKVEPAAGGKKLDDDIVHVDFPDALTGVVNTANGEVWTTADGGQTWQRK